MISESNLHLDFEKVYFISNVKNSSIIIWGITKVVEKKCPKCELYSCKMLIVSNCSSSIGTVLYKISVLYSLVSKCHVKKEQKGD